MKSKRFMAFVLAFLMVLTSFGTMAFAEAEGGSDISGHWAEASIQKWVDAGVINGYADGTFRPDNGITRAEFIKIVNGLFGFSVEGSATFTDVAGGAWYAGEVKKAVYEEFVSGYEDGSFRPDNGITRQEAAKIIDTILDMEGTDDTALNSFGDKAMIPDWSKNSLMYMVQKGYLSGYPDSTLRPAYGITRAETVALLDRVAGTVYSEAGTFGPNSGKETINGNVSVTADGVTLKNIIINGDLHVTAGVGDGDATFEDVTVKGETIINGGGMSTVTFTNTNLNGLVVTKKDGKVRILVMGDTDIDRTDLLSGAMLEQLGLTGEGFGNIEIKKVSDGETVVLDGDFEDIIIDCPADVSVTDDTTIGHLTVSENGDGAHVDVEEGCCIEEFEADAQAQVTGDGEVEKATINCCGVEIEQEVAEVTLGDDVDSANVGGATVEESTTTTTTSSGGGGSSTVALSSISIDGDTFAGKILTAKSNYGATNVTYQWQANTGDGDAFENITDATGKTFEVTIDYIGKEILVIAKGYNNSIKTSNPVLVCEEARAVTTDDVDADDDVNSAEVNCGLTVTQEGTTIYLTGELDKVYNLTADNTTELQGFGAISSYYSDSTESKRVALVPFVVGDYDIHTIILGDASETSTYNPSDYPAENLDAYNIEYTIDFTGLVWPVVYEEARALTSEDFTSPEDIWDDGTADVAWDEINQGLTVASTDGTITISGTLEPTKVHDLTAENDTVLTGFGRIGDYWSDGLESTRVTLVSFKVGTAEPHTIILGDATTTTTETFNGVEYTIDFTGLVWPVVYEEARALTSEDFTSPEDIWDDGTADVAWDEINQGLTVASTDGTITISGTLEPTKVHDLTAENDTVLTGFGRIGDYWSDGLESTRVTLVSFKVGTAEPHTIILGDATTTTTETFNGVEYTIDFTGLVWPVEAATVTTADQLRDALNNDLVGEITVTSTGDYQLYNLSELALFSRTTGVTLLAESDTSIRVVYAAGQGLTQVTEDESFKAAKARGAVYRAEEAKGDFETALASDAGAEKMTWDILIRAMYFYKEQAIPFVDALENGTVKDGLNSSVGVLTSYYEGVTGLDMSEKTESAFDISTGAIETFTGLKTLNLSGVGLSETGGLASLTALEELDVSNNNLTELNVLFVPNPKTSLKKLNASNNELANIIALVQLAQDTNFNADSVNWKISGNSMTHEDTQAHIDAIDTVFNAASNATFTYDWSN